MLVLCFYSFTKFVIFLLLRKYTGWIYFIVVFRDVPVPSMGFKVRENIWCVPKSHENKSSVTEFDICFDSTVT